MDLAERAERNGKQPIDKIVCHFASSLFKYRRFYNMKEVPIWEKTNLTLEEAAAYSGIGINKLREITNNDRCDFVLWVGTKRLIKRKQLDKFTEQCYSL